MHLELGFILKERWFCWSLGILVAISILVKQVHSSGAIGDTENNLIKPPPRASTSGLLRMCPPGGEVFTTAWQLSCGMKKRRKRDTMRLEKRDTNEYRALTLSEMMRYCCKYSCSFRDLLPFCDPFGAWDS